MTVQPEGSLKPDRTAKPLSIGGPHGIRARLGRAGLVGWDWGGRSGERRDDILAHGSRVPPPEAAALGDAQGVESSKPSDTPRADSTISKRAAIGSAARVLPSSLRNHLMASSLSRPRR